VNEAKHQAESCRPEEARRLLEQVPSDSEAVAEVLFKIGESQFAGVILTLLFDLSSS
jgi:hypothetical protein